MFRIALRYENVREMFYRRRCSIRIDNTELFVQVTTGKCKGVEIVVKRVLLCAIEEAVMTLQTEPDYELVASKDHTDGDVPSRHAKFSSVRLAMDVFELLYAQVAFELDVFSAHAVARGTRRRDGEVEGRWLAEMKDGDGFAALPYFSWRHDERSEAMDAMTQTVGGRRLYVFPPPALLQAVTLWLANEEAHGVLILEAMAEPKPAWWSLFARNEERRHELRAGCIEWRALEDWEEKPGQNRMVAVFFNCQKEVGGKRMRIE